MLWKFRPLCSRLFVYLLLTFFSEHFQYDCMILILIFVFSNHEPRAPLITV